MIISIESKKTLGKFLKVSANEHSVQIYSKQLQPGDFKDSKDVEVLTHSVDPVNEVTQEGGMVIGTAGEFEKNGIFVWSQMNSQESQGNMDFIEIEADNVRVLYFESTAEISKDLLSDIGVIDVLVINVAPEFDNQIKAIKTVDPQILIPMFGEGVDKDKFMSEAGAKFDTEKRFKCKPADFANEEYVLHGVLLEE